jgi:hypothetical protein
MEDEDITYVPNRKGGQNLKDKDGYVFTRTKMLPLKDKKLLEMYISSEVQLSCYPHLHHLDSEAHPEVWRAHTQQPAAGTDSEGFGAGESKAGWTDAHSGAAFCPGRHYSCPGDKSAWWNSLHAFQVVHLQGHPS